VSTWVRERGLLLANLALFLVFFVGMAVTGWKSYDADQADHRQPTVSFVGYLHTGDFMEATFENWESEFLQMGSYVVLTAYLYQRGSSESKPMNGPAPQDEDPRTQPPSADQPWPVRHGGWALKLYERSLAIAFFAFFLASWLLHAVGGARAYSEEQVTHGSPPVSFDQYVVSSRFWFESLQNWQSEFLAVAAIVGLSVYLRQRGSAESKPVAEPHRSTGA
jgi:hypothetical protein